MKVRAFVLATAVFSATCAFAAPGTITQGIQFRDTCGNPIQAHGGGLIKVNSTYYWVGENRYDDLTFRAVSAYSSTDLVNWDYSGDILTNSSATELNKCNIERPKVIYNAATSKFVLWAHWENGVDYNEARTMVATSSTVDGKYNYVRSFRPQGFDSRDMTTYVDTDGTGYLVSSTRSNADLNIYKLTPDYTDIDSLVVTLWNGSYREAPALFKRNNVYFLLTSGATYWNPNQQKYATASSIAGPWSALQNVGNSIAHGSQTTYVLPISQSTYLYFGDRWAPAWNGPVNQSPYVWLPLTFPSDTSLTLSWAPKLTIDVAAGALTPVSFGPSNIGSAAAYFNLKPRHSGKCIDISDQSLDENHQAIQWTCGSGGNQQFQVFFVESEGFFRLTARHSNKCLAPLSDNSIVQVTCNDADWNQQWSISDAGSGYFRIATRLSGWCLDIPGVSTADGAKVSLWNCNGGQNQQYTLAPVA
ncbi:putative beta-xylosidase, secreted [Cladochytrium replicatum]|nr:putative beta-xylosidase, secreted [Cladochytrium replicatum]